MFSVIHECISGRGQNQKVNGAFPTPFGLVCHLPEDGSLWLRQRDIGSCLEKCSERPELINLLNHIVI